MTTETGFYYAEGHYCEIEDLMYAIELTEKADVEELEDDWSIEVYETQLEPFLQLSAEWITDRLDEDRMSEDGGEVDKIRNLIKAHIDFSKVNELIPKLYYPTRKKIVLTKADLLLQFD